MRKPLNHVGAFVVVVVGVLVLVPSVGPVGAPMVDSDTKRVSWPQRSTTPVRVIRSSVTPSIVSPSSTMCPLRTADSSCPGAATMPESRMAGHLTGAGLPSDVIQVLQDAVPESPEEASVFWDSGVPVVG